VNKTFATVCLMIAVCLCSATAIGQVKKRQPHIGYLYPSGGQQGATLQVIVGGQRIQGAVDVHVSGKGVHGSIIQCYKPLRNLSKEQREALQRQLRTLLQERLAEWNRGKRSDSSVRLRNAARGKVKKRGGGRRDGKSRTLADAPGKVQKEESEASATEKSDPVELPDHPLLRGLEQKGLWELAHLGKTFFDYVDRKKQQPNAQIAEMVLVELTIDANAEPGDRELRLMTAGGLANPLLFQVGTLPEILELEPNGPQANNMPKLFERLPQRPSIDLPILINGQIKPGDVDRFRFRARRGDSLVLEVQARHLIPYLADAVPGWFQATLALYDESGSEIAFVDDYQFYPDPVLFYKIKQSGEYELEIRDSIYRGREDFIYRIAISRRPFITNIFPLGGRAGIPAVASIAGWNLKQETMPLGTGPGIDRLRHASLPPGDRPRRRPSNRVVYAVDRNPECVEVEPNDDPQQAQLVVLPILVNGRIQEPGDLDYFRLQGRAGAEVVAEVSGRRLHSPIDSLLQLFDADGNRLAWNDDHQDRQGHLHRDLGPITHHADSYVRFRLPADGIYLVQIADAQHQGGDAYGYRLRITPPQPDFSLRQTPSSLNIRAGAAAPICIYALRKDGYQGPIDVSLRDPPAGFVLDGSQIPAGENRIQMTLFAPGKPPANAAPGNDQAGGGAIVLNLQGEAEIGGQKVIRRVIPAEDMMQAFLYRHLTPSQELAVAVLGKRRGPQLRLELEGKVRISMGGTAQVKVWTANRLILRQIEFKLKEPPAGIALERVIQEPGGVVLRLTADADAAQVGLEDNLIVELSWKKNKGGVFGVLPAIPIEIVSAEAAASAD
jgi:hypothetical protein